MKYEIVRTGKTDTVAGYQCEIFQTKSKETGKIRGEACAAKGLANMGAFMGLNRGAAPRLRDFSKEIRQIIKEGYFLLRMVRKDDDGSERLRVEATSVEKRKLDSSLFVPPADYTKLDMNAMRNKRNSPLEEGSKGREGGRCRGTSPLKAGVPLLPPLRVHGFFPFEVQKGVDPKPRTVRSNLGLSVKSDTRGDTVTTGGNPASHCSTSAYGPGRTRGKRSVGFALLSGKIDSVFL